MADCNTLQTWHGPQARTFTQQDLPAAVTVDREGKPVIHHHATAQGQGGNASSPKIEAPDVR